MPAPRPPPCQHRDAFLGDPAGDHRPHATRSGLGRSWPCGPRHRDGCLRTRPGRNRAAHARLPPVPAPADGWSRHHDVPRRWGVVSHPVATRQACGVNDHGPTTGRDMPGDAPTRLGRLSRRTLLLGAGLCPTSRDWGWRCHRGFRRRSLRRSRPARRSWRAGSRMLAR